MSAFAEVAPVLAAELRKRLEAGDLDEKTLSAWIEQLLELGADSGRQSAIGHRCITIAELLRLAQADEDAERDEG